MPMMTGSPAPTRPFPNTCIRVAIAVDQKGNLNQDGFVGAVKTNRVGYKDRRRHDADNRRDDMLEPERKHLPGRRHACQFEYGASVPLLISLIAATSSQNFFGLIFFIGPCPYDTASARKLQPDLKSSIKNISPEFGYFSQLTSHMNMLPAFRLRLV